MALPPTSNSSPPAAPDASFPPSPAASPCGFTLPTIPKFNFGFKLPALAFPPSLPIPPIPFKLSCDPTKPIDVTSALNLPFGGGRVNNSPPDPDLDEST